MAMAVSICSSSNSSHLLLRSTNPLSFLFFPCSLSPPPLRRVPFSFPSLRARAERGNSRSGDAGDPALLRKPVISVEKVAFSEEQVDDDDDGAKSDCREKEVEWVDWEDQILEDTVPLVGFARMVLHSGKYESGDRLSVEHEKAIIERLLPYHPESEKKIGCGIDYITVGYHPDFESSRCLFIVRKDGVSVDFSYWKCIKGLIRKKYPLYADSFILRHFRKRRRGE